MNIEELRRQTKGHGLPDSWLVLRENETEARPEPMTLREAEGLLSPDWGVAVLNVKFAEMEPQRWHKLAYQRGESDAPISAKIAAHEPARKKQQIWITKPALILMGIMLGLIGAMAIFHRAEFDYSTDYRGVALVILIPFGLYFCLRFVCSSCAGVVESDAKACPHCRMDLRDGNQSTQPLPQLDYFLVCDWEVLSDGETGMQLGAPRAIKKSNQTMINVGVLLILVFGVGFIFIIIAAMNHWGTERKKVFIPKRKT